MLQVLSVLLHALQVDAAGSLSVFGGWWWKDVHLLDSLEEMHLVLEIV